MSYSLRLAPVRASWAGLAALWLLALLPWVAEAQAPTWQEALSGNNNQPNGGTSVARASAVDTRGNVFVTGSFTGQVTFGSTQLVSLGFADVFVAKWDATTHTWAWAVAGGGDNSDVGRSIAVSGSEIYVTGTVTNSGNAGTSTDFGVQFGGVPLYSASTTAISNTDVFIARYTDGAAPLYRWAVAGGGMQNDAGYGIAVSGGELYVTGSVLTSGSLGTSTSSGVQFGGTPLYSTSTTSASNADLFIARYTDGAAPTYRWAVAGGGTGNDYGYGIAVSGSELYVTGQVTNSGTLNATTTQAVQFGGVPLFSASTTSLANADVVVARYTDGATPTYRWAVASGGTSTDIGNSIAVSGGEVYITGQVLNSGSAGANTGQAVQFGGAPLYSASTTATPNADVFLVRYSDGATPTYRWAKAGGGTGSDVGYGIAVSSGEVYITGYVSNSGTLNASTTPGVQFGGTLLFSASTTATLNSDVFVTHYTDGATPTYQWAVAGGGTGGDVGYGLAVSSQQVYSAQVNGVAIGSYGGVPAPVSAAILGQLGAGTGTWQRADVPLQGGSSVVRATALDASGNVFLTGWFTGQVGFGAAQLVSTGSSDVFIAKWDAMAHAWAWAVAGGGTGIDYGFGIAVNGTEVYVTGQTTNSGTLNASTTQAVQFGSVPLFSASTTSSANTDVFVARYTDGPTPTYRWAVAGGGTQNDVGSGIAVNGDEVYVTGYVTNSGTLNASTTQAVQFGGAPLFSASTTSSVNQDVFVARYTNGLTPTYRWALAGGGASNDEGLSIAVSGDEVYVTGYITNSGTLNASTTQAVQFGGVPLYSASTSVGTNLDMLLVRYTDGSTPICRWAVAGGGTSQDIGSGIAVSGANIYVTGQVTNSGTLNASTDQAVQFGGVPLFSASTTSSANLDMFVARYTDGTTPTYRWARTGGGTNIDLGIGLAISGSEVYVTGYITNSGTSNASTGQAVQFGGAPLYSASTTSSANPDVFVVRYTDGATPTYRWAVTGGGPATDIGYGIAVRGTDIYVGGQVAPPATFSSLPFGNSASGTINFLAHLIDSTPLPVQLVSFTASASGLTAVVLTWATASEKNSAHFEVERSLEGILYTKVGTVVAAGTTATTHTYAFLDEKFPPLPAHPSTYYYRLRQVDLDGTTSYSPVRVVRRASGGPGLFPNPARGLATLSGVAPGQAVQVLDVLGRLVLSTTANAAGTVTLTLPAGLPGGVYLVQTGAQALRLTIE